ncbi:MAG: cation transporter [Candidatus Omnitrophota bacterium]|jgi:cation diffusion facilitator family transporter|nr:MAG: cation transporter [Candidatus Omnitrophota bacterium]
MEQDLSRRTAEIKKILIIILAFNWGVALAKIVYGALSKCSSISADGFHSLSDGASNIIALIGIHLASKPKDLDHPYGHRKYETLFSLAISAFLFIVAFNLFRVGLLRINNPVIPDIGLGALIVMLTTLSINLAVMIYEKKQGLKLKSDILISDSMHTQTDIFTSISVIIALAAIKLGFPIIDPIVTMVISLFIAYSGYRIIQESSRVLCDTAAIIDSKKIVDLVLRIKGVRSCHKIRTRGRSDDIYIDLHVQVDPDMHMDEAHKVCYDIERVIKLNIEGVTDVIVHLEPKENN